MEGLESFHACVKNLCHQARILAEVAVSLSQSFEIEADRLTREDGAHHLKAIHAAVVEKLGWSKRLESAASYRYTKASLFSQLLGSLQKSLSPQQQRTSRRGTS